MKDLEIGINLDDLGGFTLVTGVLEVESISWLRLERLGALFLVLRDEKRGIRSSGVDSSTAWCRHCLLFFSAVSVKDP